MQTLDNFLTIKEFSKQNMFLPEQELLIAILDRAVLDYCAREGDLHIKAKTWLFEEGSLDDVFSFNSVCEHLNLNPEAIREKIKFLEIPKNVSQSHRWLRKKIQSSTKKRTRKKRSIN